MDVKVWPQVLQSNMPSFNLTTIKAVTQIQCTGFYYYYHYYHYYHYYYYYYYYYIKVSNKM